MVIQRTILKIWSMDEVLWEKRISDKGAEKAFLKSEFFKISKTSGKLAGDLIGMSKTEDMANIGELWGGYCCGYTS
jgi:hypothetical protein